MESRWQTSTILWHFLLTYSLLTITVSNAFRLRDLQETVKHIPLTRASPDRGFRFLQGPDFHFDKELHELNNLRLRRSVQGSVRVQNRTKITEEFELTGDNHTVAFLHWAGKKSPVIYIYTCGKVNQTESEDVICEDAYFWRSTDYGSTFKREDNKFKSQAINNVDFCHSNHKKVIVSILKPKPTMYISDDEGESFNEVFLNFSPHVISCNRLSNNLIVAHDQHTKKVHYSSDGGKRWSPLANDVLRHYWAPVQVKGKSAGVFLEVQTNLKYTSELKHAKLPCISESTCVQVFDKTLGPFMSNTLEVAGKYVFVQKDLKLKGLYVFYQNSSDPKANTNFFQLARFPLDVEEKSYRVVDASENEMMVVVRHEKDDKSYYNLYVSDVMGVKFALSLENILSSRREVWGQNTTLVDIYRVKGLNGTYLANVYVEDKFGGKPSFKSVITYNKGGEWHPLKPPDLDHKGIPTNCYLPHCSLHIHMTVSRWYYYIPTVMSSTSAIGIIVAQGNLGNGLGEGAIGVFLSNDGGLTWTKEFHSFHDFVIGDHGGILAAVPMRHDVDKVWYSCTEGKVWSNVTLGSKPVYVYGMVTEPGETTLIFNVFGQYASQAFQWLSVKLNFTSVLNQKCLPDNYTYWSPNDERVDGQCLLGQHIVFERRKSGDCCFNGDEYEREINVSACTCENDDFECDFGYEHGVFGGVCVATSSAAPIPAICPEGKTYQHTRGYRKVIGDRCKGGVEKKLMPETRPCPIKAPGKLNIKFAAVSKTVEVNKPVNFNLSQKEGSTESTWYAWDFGDGSPVLNITGLSKAEHVQHTFSKHGDFVVQLTAANKAGRSVVTAGIVAKDPITSIDIDPPHAVVIGQEAWFNVTLHSNNLVNPEYGFVHFMWFFEKDDKNKNQKPLLTWDNEVSHTFSTPGVHEVSVTGISVIGQQKSAQVPITVYEDLTTVRLSFDLALDDENDNTKAWRDYFSQRLQASLSQVLDVDTSRLEVVVLRGKPTVSDVSITPAPTNSSKTRKEIVALLKEKVYTGAVKVQLPKETTIRVTRVEVLPGRGFDGNSSPTDSSGSGVGTRLAIGVGIAAGLIVVFLVVTLLYFLRRYNLLRSRYTHLRLYSDGGQLRDPLIEDDTEDEQSLHAQPGGSLRYVPVPTSTAPDPDSDEELIENFEGGSLALMPAGQNGQVQEHNVNA